MESCRAGRDRHPERSPVGAGKGGREGAGAPGENLNGSNINMRKELRLWSQTCSLTLPTLSNLLPFLLQEKTRRVQVCQKVRAQGTVWGRGCSPRVHLLPWCSQSSARQRVPRLPISPGIRIIAGVDSSSMDCSTDAL